jgi:hypothetical protein
MDHFATESGWQEIMLKIASPWAVLTFAFLSCAHLALASISVQLTPSLSTAPVGATVTWTAAASDSANSSATFNYHGNSLALRSSTVPLACKWSLEKILFRGCLVDTTPGTFRDHEILPIMLSL